METKQESQIDKVTLIATKLMGWKLVETKDGYECRGPKAVAFIYTKINDKINGWNPLTSLNQCNQFANKIENKTKYMAHLNKAATGTPAMYRGGDEDDFKMAHATTQMRVDAAVAYLS